MDDPALMTAAMQKEAAGGERSRGDAPAALRLGDALQWALAFLIASYLGYWLRNLLDPYLPVGRPDTTVLFVAAGGAAVLAAALRPLARRLPEAIGFRKMPGFHVLLIAVLACPLDSILLNLTIVLPSQLPRFFSAPFVHPLLLDPWQVGFLAACIVVPLVEETFFRGFLGTKLIARHGAVRGTLFASVLYGMAQVHLRQAIVATIEGCVLQFVYLESDSLWSSILLRALMAVFSFWPSLFLDSRDLPLMAILAVTTVLGLMNLSRAGSPAPRPHGGRKSSTDLSGWQQFSMRLACLLIGAVPFFALLCWHIQQMLDTGR